MILSLTSYNICNRYVFGFYTLLYNEGEEKNILYHDIHGRSCRFSIGKAKSFAQIGKNKNVLHVCAAGYDAETNEVFFIPFSKLLFV